MNYKYSILIAWCIYVGAISTELLVDYILRKANANFYTGGISETIWFSIQILAVAAAGYFVIMGSSFLNNNRQKILSLIVNFVLGVFFYVVAVYSYVLGLGIDSL